MAGAKRCAERRGRAPDGAALRRDPPRGPRHRPDDRLCCRRRGGSAAARRPSTASRTWRTCRRRRSSRRPTRSAPTASCVRRSRSTARDASSRGSPCASKAAAPCRSTPTRRRRHAARDHRARRGRDAARRARARRPRGPHRPARHRLLRHAARRERREPPRARRGVRVGCRRGGPRPHQPLVRSTSTSWSDRPRSTSLASRATANACRCCAIRPGSSSAPRSIAGFVLRRPERGLRPPRRRARRSRVLHADMHRQRQTSAAFTEDQRGGWPGTEDDDRSVERRGRDG